MQTPDALLTHNLRPRRSSHWYGMVALTIAVGLYLLMLLAQVAFAKPPSDASLRRSLLTAARPKVAELRKKLSRRVAIGQSSGLFLRAPQCQVKEITETKVLRFGRSITGVVRVACVWQTPDQRTFDSREEAEDAELTEQEPGKLRLTFVWLGEHWQYKGAKKAQ